MKSTQYKGRFAPSPTGPLHFGSLLAAVASYADARSQQGTWLLRIDDIDPPRAMPGAELKIPETLARFGFIWDGEPIFQSSRSTVYDAALEKLNQDASLYLCQCSRQDLKGKPVYPGHCKPTSTPSHSEPSIRQQVLDKLSKSDTGSYNQKAIRVIMESNVSFNDQVQSLQEFQAGNHFGDTVVVRRDELYSYTLCCAVDDADGITHVVRGYDLLPTTASQLGLINALGLAAPQYAHIPVATNERAQKLSKQTQANAIDDMPVLKTLKSAWAFLGQATIDATSVESFWSEAIVKWRISRVPKTEAIYAPY